MAKTVSVTEARRRFGKIIHQAQTGPVILTRRGEPVAVILSVQEYERLTQTDVRHTMRTNNPRNKSA